MPDTTNLHSETLAALARLGRSAGEVLWVGSKDGKLAIPWAEFSSIADVNYYSGYGSQEIATDLVVVLEGGRWLERSEYDGSERWALKQAPVRASDSRPFRRVKVNTESEVGWCSLSALQQEDTDE